jgi:hypothetical protein
MQIQSKIYLEFGRDNAKYWGAEGKDSRKERIGHSGCRKASSGRARYFALVRLHLVDG